MPATMTTTGFPPGITPNNLKDKSFVQNAFQVRVIFGWAVFFSPDHSPRRAASPTQPNPLFVPLIQSARMLTLLVTLEMEVDERTRRD